jgi:hypothetical protein
VLVIFFVGLVNFVFGFLVEDDSNLGTKIKPNIVGPLGLAAVTVAIVADILESSTALGTWTGPIFVLSALAGVISGLTVVALLAARRERRHGNPLRACLLASGQHFADRTSVIR